MLSQNLLNLIDTAMVGQLGSTALAAVGFGGMVNWLANAFFIGMGAGVQAIASRRSGEGNNRGALSALHGALVVALLVVVPYSLLISAQSGAIYDLLSDDPAVIESGVPYLSIRLCAAAFVAANFSFRGYWNGIGRSMVYLSTILVINSLNVFLNWVLIYGNLGFAPLGVEGAGLASAIAVAVGTGTYFVMAWRFSRKEGFLARGGLPRGTLPSIFRLSIPAGLQNVFMSLGFVILYRLAQMIGTRELAATSVLINLALVCILPAIGFGLAAATLVGQSLGRKEPQEAMRWGWWTVYLAFGSLSVLAAVLAVAPRTWLGLLVNDPITVSLAVLPLVLLAIVQPLDSVGAVLSQALISAGAVRTVMVYSISMQWGFFLPLVYLWSVKFDGGLVALFIAMGIWRTLYSVVMMVIWRRGRWADIDV
jgi:putative MATE family efflux protein